MIDLQTNKIHIHLYLIHTINGKQNHQKIHLCNKYINSKELTSELI